MEFHLTEERHNEQDEQETSIQAEVDQQQTVPMALDRQEQRQVPASDLVVL